MSARQIGRATQDRSKRRSSYLAVPPGRINLRNSHVGSAPCSLTARFMCVPTVARGRTGTETVGRLYARAEPTTWAPPEGRESPHRRLRRSADTTIPAPRPPLLSHSPCRQLPSSPPSAHQKPTERGRRHGALHGANHRAHFCHRLTISWLDWVIHSH